jgi:hypothetical protein
MPGRNAGIVMHGKTSSAKTPPTGHWNYCFRMSIIGGWKKKRGETHFTAPLPLEVNCLVHQDEGD